MGFFGGPTTNTSQQGSNTGTSTSSGLSTSLLQGSSSQQGSNVGSNTSQSISSTTPNLPAWYSSFLSSIPGQMQALQSAVQQNSQTPLYGPQQQAAFQGNLNQTQGQASQALNSQLASAGALNSERADQQQTQLALGGQQQLSNYLANVPQLNAQNALQNNSLLNAINNSAAGFTSPISAFGSTSMGDTQQLTNLITSLLGNTSQSGVNTTSNGGTTSSTSASSGSSQVTPNILGGAALGGITSAGQLLSNLLMK